MSATKGATTHPNPSIVVTRDGLDIPEGCGPHGVALFVHRFFDDFNRGRVVALRRRVAPTSRVSDPAKDARDDGRLGFRWYSVTTSQANFASYSRETLFRYFARRNKKQERLQLVMVDVGGRGAGAQTVAFSFVLVRKADDLAGAVGGETYFGKAELNCSPKAVYVWSMAGPNTPSPWPCPLPPAWAPGDPIVACTRS